MLAKPRIEAGRFVAVLALLLCFPSTALADPTAEDKAGARSAATQANTAFAAKRYTEALDLFTRAESLMHAPTHVLMIARSQVALGQLVRGRESYLALLRETLPATAPPAFRDAQVEGKKELDALEPRVPSVNVKVDDPNAQSVVITMDGAAISSALIGIARPVDPGQHVFKARGAGVASDEKSLHVDEGAKIVLVLPLKPAPGETGAVVASGQPGDGAPPPSKSLKYAGYAGIGVGVIGLGLGGVFLGLGASERGQANDAYAACGGTACPKGSPGSTKTLNLDSEATSKENIGLIALIAGGALGATGVTLLLLSPKQDTPAQGTTVMPWVGLGSAGVRGSF